MVVRELLTTWGFDIDDTPLRKADDLMHATMKSALALTGVITGLALSVKSVAMAFSENEKTTIAFETMMGSVEEAQKMLGDLAKFAAKTPFDLIGVQENAKQLMAMGINTDKVIDTMKMLGDVSAGVNVPLSRIAMNYGQIKSMGKAMTIDMKQFAMMGIPIYDELSKITGKSRDQIMQMTTDGQIGFDLIEKAFENMTKSGGKFNDLMFKQSATLGGMLSNLGDNIDQIKIKLGAFTSKPLKELLTRINQFLDKNLEKIIFEVGKAIEWATMFLIDMVGVFWEIGKVVWNFIDAVGGLDKVLKILVYALTAITALGFGFAILAYAKSMWDFANAIFTANKALAMLYLKVFAVVAVIGLVFLVLEDIYQFINGNGSLTEDLLSSLFDKSTVESVRSIFKTIYDIVTSFFSGIWDGFSPVIDEFTSLWSELAEEFKAEWEIISKMISYFLKDLGFEFESGSKGFIDFVKMAAKLIGTVVGASISAFMRLLIAFSRIGIAIVKFFRENVVGVIKKIPFLSEIAGKFFGGTDSTTDINSKNAAYMSDEAFDQAMGIASGRLPGIEKDVGKSFTSSSNNMSSSSVNIEGGINVNVENTNANPEDIGNVVTEKINQTFRFANADLEPQKER